MEMTIKAFKTQQDRTVRNLKGTYEASTDMVTLTLTNNPQHSPATIRMDREMFEAVRDFLTSDTVTKPEIDPSLIDSTLWRGADRYSADHMFRYLVQIDPDITLGMVEAHHAFVLANPDLKPDYL